MNDPNIGTMGGGGFFLFQAIVQAGSLAIFGDTTNLCDEDAPHGTGFSVDVCKAWESAFFAEEFPASRKVMLRIGFALGKNGGALEPLMKLDMKTEPDLALTGRNCVPKRLLENGFTFRYRDLEEALREIITT